MLRALGLAVVLVPVSAFAQSDNPNVQARCERSELCNVLQNSTPDFSYYEAEVVEVIDADTIVFDVHIWPGMVVTTGVRLRGVDAPAVGGRAACDAERIAGERAKRAVERRYSVGDWAIIQNLEPGKFSERVVGDVVRWRSDRLLILSDELLANKEWVRPYDGTGPRHDWCS